MENMSISSPPSWFVGGGAIEFMVVKKTYLDSGGDLSTLYNNWDSNNWFASNSSMQGWTGSSLDSSINISAFADFQLRFTNNSDYVVTLYPVGSGVTQSYFESWKGNDEIVLGILFYEYYSNMVVHEELIFNINSPTT